MRSAARGDGRTGTMPAPRGHRHDHAVGTNALDDPLQVTEGAEGAGGLNP